MENGKTMNKEHRTEGLQRAVRFFQHPARARLLHELYSRYITLGRVGGQVVLKDSTAEERMEIASFLGKRLPAAEEVTVRLADFQRALQTSSFACDLPDLLRASFPDHPHLTNPQQRERRARRQQEFRADLQALVDELPTTSHGRCWLHTGAHGMHALFSRYKNATPEEQKQVLEFTAVVTYALDELPSPPTFERLARFAQRISGDPHYFDLNTPGGRLFFHALTDLARMKHSEAHRISANEDFSTEHLAAVDQAAESENLVEPGAAADRVLLYYDAGLLLDTISTTVTACQLMYAEDQRGERDPLLVAAGTRILVLPLRQMLAWTKLVPTSERVYVFENPQVFETVVDELQQQNPNKLPTMVCTAGWPSAAAMRLLDLLQQSSSAIHLYYSGDFDLPGLRIAAHLLERYPGRCHLWRFDPATYLAALHTRSIPLSAADRSDLQALPPAFTPLAAVMQEQGKKAYQEGIMTYLLEDLRCL